MKDKAESRHAFFVTVPYVLVLATNFVVSNDLKHADVYISKSFNDAELVADRLREADVFEKVFVIDNVLLTYPITLSKCINVVLNGKKVVKQIAKTKYDYAYYCNSGWLVNSIFYTGVYDGNSGCKQRFLEHGYATYLVEYGKKPLYLKPLINIMGYRCMDGTMLEALYMFDKTLLQVPYNGELRIMPRLDKRNQRLLNALNITFGFDPENNEYNDKDIIILEQGALKMDFDKEKLWTPILENIDHQRAIIKAHPRQKGSSLQNSGICCSKNFSIPWEVVVLNSDIEGKLCITINSTSAISPKICFDSEPTVIMLYKLLASDYTKLVDEKMSKLFNVIKSRYRKDDRVFIPDSEAEFLTFLRNYKIKDNK